MVQPVKEAAPANSLFDDRLWNNLLTGLKHVLKCSAVLGCTSVPLSRHFCDVPSLLAIPRSGFSRRRESEHSPSRGKFPSAPVRPDFFVPAVSGFEFCVVPSFV